MLRLFIALRIPPNVQQNLSRVIHEDITGFRWVRPSNYHITLQFLGDVPAQRVAVVKRAMDQSVQSISEPFCLAIKNIDAFPNIHRIRTLWSGVHGDTHRLRHLQRELTDHLAQHEFQKPRRQFHPHVTIARVRHPIPLPGMLQPYRQRAFGESWVVRSMQLIISELLPSGPRYRVEYDCPIP